MRLNMVCQDCHREHALWRQSVGCYLCDNCYTDDLFETERDSVIPENVDDGYY